MTEEEQQDAMGVPENSKGKGYKNKLALLERRVNSLKTFHDERKYDALFDDMLFLLRHFDIWLFDSTQKEPLIEILCDIFAKVFEENNELQSMYGSEKVLELCPSHSM